MKRGHTTSTTNQNNISELGLRFANNFILGLRHLFKLPLDFYSCMVSSGKLSLRRSRTLQISALASSFALILAIVATLAPLYNKTDITEAATGTAKESSLSLNVTNSTASVDLGVVKDNGSFASSTNPIAFNVTTTNYTGYTLSIKNSKTTTDLVNTTANGAYTSDSNKYATLSSITSATSSSTFSADDVATGNSYNGKYGLLYSKLNSTTNTSYQPSPTSTTATTLDKTTAANSSANTYTIGIGARASYTQPAGTYTGTYTLTAVGNAITYYLAFNDNSGDSTVSGLPNAMSSSISTTSVTLPTATPTRTGYTFKSWCLGTVSNSGTTCTGTEYAKGASFGIDQTSSNGSSTTPVTLYAVWTINSYAQTVEYYCQSATGAASSKYTYTQNVNYGSTFTFTSSNATSCYNSTYHNSTIYTTNNGTTSKTISYKVTGASTNTAYFNRNTRTVTLTKGTGISTVSVTGTGVKSGSGTASATVYYGGAVIIAATMTSGYDWMNWTGSATYADRSQSISSVTSNLSFTGNGKASAVTIAAGSTTTMQSISSKADGGCPDTLTAGTAYTLTDSRDGQTYQVARLAGGNCWMLENLRLGVVALKETLTTSNTNMLAIDFVLPSSISNGFNSNIEAQINTSSYNKTYSYGSGKGKVGVYYNYCAASAGAVCTYNYSGIQSNYDICPKGWRMPTGGNSGEYVDLYNSYGRNVANFKNAFRTPSSGYFYNSSAEDQGSSGGFWSSTNFGGDYINALYIGTSDVYPAGTVLRSKGYSVRCILK